MSVLVKGMKMPVNCPLCPLSHWDIDGKFTGCDAISNKRYAISDPSYASNPIRPDWCPLVAVKDEH